MIEVKEYKALTVPADKADQFTGRRQREVRGYYVKHINACPYPISTQYERDKFIAEHTKHYIFSDGFADWGLMQELEQWEIDPETLREA